MHLSDCWRREQAASGDPVTSRRRAIATGRASSDGQKRNIHGNLALGSRARSPNAAADGTQAGGFRFTAVPLKC